MHYSHRFITRSLAGLSISLLAACASAPETTLTVPTSARPIAAPQPVERVVTGSLFRPDAPISSLFSSERRPRAVGDTLKVDIAEELRARSRQSGDLSRENKLSSKGPGTKSGVSKNAFDRLLNLDATASGSDSFKGSGEAQNDSSFQGRIAATVINVLENGHLLVAGERSITMSGGTTTLRLSGIVNPVDIKAGNIVVSGDVVNARLEIVGTGDAANSSRRSWLQRVLTDSLRVW